MFRIGCHISFSGGFAKMAQDAVSINATTFQFFSRNPRGGASKVWTDADIAKYVEITGANDIALPLAHAPYTINPCSDNERTREFAYETLADDLTKLERIPGAMYIFHPGSHVGQGIERGIELIAECLNASVPDGTVPVLLETMSGKGSEIGGRFEELAAIIKRADKVQERLGVCLDTCHVFDAGYDIRNDLDVVLLEFDAVIGLDRLRAVHLNDSKNPFASHKDRHEVVGTGSLGTETFRAVINHPLLRDLPFYLETPQEDLDGYGREIEFLRGLRE